MKIFSRSSFQLLIVLFCALPAVSQSETPVSGDPFGGCETSDLIGTWLHFHKTEPVRYHCEAYRRIAPQKPTFTTPSKLPRADTQRFLQSPLETRESILSQFAGKPTRYKELGQILTTQASVFSSKDPRTAAFFDSAILNILSTNYGAALCMDQRSGSLVSFLRTFGMSASAQISATAICTRKGPNHMEAAFQAMYSADRDQAEYAKRRREFLLIFAEEFEAPYSGWTNAEGVTYMTFRPSAFNSENFYRLLSHELYVLSDVLISDYGLGVNPYLEMFRFVRDKVPEADFVKASSNPLVAYSLLASRAEVMESWILWDLGFNIERVSTMPTNCVDRLMSILPSVLALKPLYKNQASYEAKVLAEDLLSVANSSKLCPTMFYPLSGTVILGGLAGSGPRPRSGSGWESHGSQQPSELYNLVQSANKDELTRFLETFISKTLADERPLL